METIKLYIKGMQCGGCIAKVSNALKSVPGAKVDEVVVGSARVSFDPAKATGNRFDGRRRQRLLRSHRVVIIYEESLLGRPSR